MIYGRLIDCKAIVPVIFRLPVGFFDKMKQENRFTSDVWGVQLHFKQAIKQVQKDNYSKAEGWLIRVQKPTDTQAPVKELVQPLTV